MFEPDHIPQPETQVWLVEALATLIQARGPATFLTQPMVLPISAFLPRASGSGGQRRSRGC